VPLRPERVARWRHFNDNDELQQPGIVAQPRRSSRHCHPARLVLFDRPGDLLDQLHVPSAPATRRTTPSGETAMIAHHASFTVTRDYPHSLENVFRAFADADTKRRWAGSRNTQAPSGFTSDFRIDGRESSFFHLPDAAHLPPHIRGQLITQEAVFQDIIDRERIVYAYRMSIGGVCMSVSLATVEFARTAAGTRLIFTEQGSYFDNADGAAMRAQGWNGLLDSLGRELAAI
jgi:uncharacterized protein YndB with AHSA1/START domain